MLPEFAHTPFELIIDLNSYEGPWTHVEAFRGREGWLRVARATIQSEHDLLSAKLIAACDECGNPLASWRAIHLTECRWTRLLPCSVEPPAIIDDLLCEEEGAFYARWQREMNVDVAAAALKATIAIEQLEAWHTYRTRQIGRKLRTLRRERLMEAWPERKIQLGQAIRSLEEEEDELAETTALQRRRLRLLAEAEEEALWDRSDLLIEIEPYCTIHWHADATVLHNRSTVFDRRPYHAPAKRDRQRERDGQPRRPRMPTPAAPVFRPATVPAARPTRSPSPVPPVIVERPPAPPRQAPPPPSPRPPAPEMSSALPPAPPPTSIRPKPPLVSPLVAPKPAPGVQERHSKEAARLLASVGPLRNWAKARDHCQPPGVTKVTLVIYKRDLWDEGRKVGLQQAAPDVTPRQSMQLFELREELADALDAVNRALEWYRNRDEEAAAAAEPEPIIEESAIEEAVEPEPEMPQVPPLSAKEWQILTDQRAELAADVGRLERMLAVLKTFAPRKAVYAAQLSDAEAEIAKIDEALLRGKAIDDPVTDDPSVPAPQGNWTTEEIETLTKMWLEGESAATIGRALGGRKRNAVIGKAQRLGLQSRVHEVVEDNAGGAR
jgi:hypothetical protein